MTEVLYDSLIIVWDGIPIILLCVFHYQNFKPFQQRLIIRTGEADLSEDDMETPMLREGSNASGSI